jgi:hypothetical protein
MSNEHSRWPFAVALTASGAALGLVGSQLLKQQGSAGIATLATALVKQALLNGPIVATGISAAAAIAGAVIVPAVVVYALSKWNK